MNWCLILLLTTVAASAAPASRPEGFGADTQGGAGGRVLLVTRLDDDPQHPAKGSLRWALKQKGPRIVRFAIAGDVMLRDRVIIRESFLTIDGTTAPGRGVCIRNGSLQFKNTHDIIVRGVRIRLGDEPVLRANREAGLERPKGSAGLDCVSLDDCQRVLFDHCSLSWSCDEIFGIVRCREVTIQWCILSEPLVNPKIHPYGNNHAYCVNASASTLSIHHCLMHRFVMRGPQFECNDMRTQDLYTVQMEAVNNVISGYTHSGSRYSVGVEKGSGTGENKAFEFQFLNNLYLPASPKAQAIEKISRHGQDANIRFAARGNRLLETPKTQGTYPRLHPLSHKGPMPAIRVRQTTGLHLIKVLSTASPMSNSGPVLFQPVVPIKTTSAQDACMQVLNSAGDSARRDPVDARIRREVLALQPGKPVRSPTD